MLIALTVVLFVAAFVSGMLGQGVAILAVPILGLFGYGLKDTIQPWALLLNTVTSLGAAIVFSRARLVDWRCAVPMLVVACATAPVGVALAHFASDEIIWSLYIVTLVAVAAEILILARTSLSQGGPIRTGSRFQAELAAAPASAVSSFLGVGAGFLFVPILVTIGYSTRVAAATSSAAVTGPSAIAFASHSGNDQLNWTYVAVSCVAATIGSLAGARFTSSRLTSTVLSQVFAAVLLVLALERALSL